MPPSTPRPMPRHRAGTAARHLSASDPPGRAVRRGAVLLLALLTAFAAPAQEPEPPSQIEIRRGDEVIYSNVEPEEGAVRVLFIGNSLTYFNEMPWLFEVVAESVRPERPVTARFAGRSGISLERQWEREETRRLLSTREWDFVVLQEKSFRPLGNPESHRKYLKIFVEEIRRRGATPVVYATWPKYRQQEEHGPLAAVFARRAEELDVAVAPVGSAWRRATAEGIDLYQDSHHAGVRGAYLTACVFAAVLLDLDPRGATHDFPTDFAAGVTHRRSLAEDELSAETARRLQEIAWETVRGET